VLLTGLGLLIPHLVLAGVALTALLLEVSWLRWRIGAPAAVSTGRTLARVWLPGYQLVGLPAVWHEQAQALARLGAPADAVKALPMCGLGLAISATAHVSVWAATLTHSWPSARLTLTWVGLWVLHVVLSVYFLRTLRRALEPLLRLAAHQLMTGEVLSPGAQTAAAAPLTAAAPTSEPPGAPRLTLPPEPPERDAPAAAVPPAAPVGARAPGAGAPPRGPPPRPPAASPARARGALARWEDAVTAQLARRWRPLCAGVLLLGAGGALFAALRPPPHPVHCDPGETPETLRLEDRVEHGCLDAEGRWTGPLLTRTLEGADLSRAEHWKGQRSGPYVSWHPNGLVAERGSFREGKREGTWTSYSEDGQSAHEVDHSLEQRAQDTGVGVGAPEEAAAEVDGGTAPEAAALARGELYGGRRPAWWQERLTALRLRAVGAPLRAEVYALALARARRTGLEVREEAGGVQVAAPVAAPARVAAPAAAPAGAQVSTAEP
jgi:hypothetical protein